MKVKILFVGSFKEKTKDGSVGGIMFACNTIINSKLSDSIDWILLDSTADSNKLINNFNRVLKALKRLFLFCYYLLFYKVDKVLIFTADGWSFWEKGVMVLIAKRFSKCKVVLAPRSGIILNDMENNSMLRKFIPHVISKADYVICQSNIWKQYFESITSQSNNEKFKIVENGINLDKYIHLPIDSDKHDDEIVSILYLAWVDKNKGIVELLDAAKRLSDEGVKYKLIIAGNGTAFEETTNFVQKNNLEKDVVIYGWAIGEAKLKLLSESKIFILPTHFEGYPNSLIEAMASGKACIATKVGSIPDIIENGTTGLLIEKNNVDEIYYAIKSLLNDSALRNSLSINARNIAIKRNSIDAAIKQMQFLLE